MKCVVCKSPDIELRKVEEEIRVDTDIVLIPIEVLVCQNCGERYYDRQAIRKGLGHDFLLSKGSFGQVEVGMRFIERNPEIYRAEYRQTRKCLLKRFPYKIIYVIEENEAIVLAVLHGKRSPRVMKERMK
ncbi:MAG: YgiT-type zinc finger protein [Bacteroidetes bacterium]|nr:YgiT-type zinc finger protein [Bacteroidota bacterium]